MMQEIADYLVKQLRQAGESAQRSSRRGGQIADQYIGGKRQGGQDLSNLANEVIGMSPVTGGVIAPTANKTLQSLWKQLENAAPKVYKAAQDDPRTLLSYLVNPNAMPGEMGRGLSGAYRSIKSTLHPEIPSQAGEAYVNAGQRSSEYLPTLLHETGHFMTDPLLAGKNPMHALETAQQLGRMMPKKQAKDLGLYTELPPEMLTLRAPTSQAAARKAYNEARSYLQESLLQPTTSGGDPMLGLIADALGLGLR